MYSAWHRFWVTAPRISLAGMKQKRDTLRYKLYDSPSRFKPQLLMTHKQRRHFVPEMKRVI